MDKKDITELMLEHAINLTAVWIAAASLTKPEEKAEVRRLTDAFASTLSTVMRDAGADHNIIRRGIGKRFGLPGDVAEQIEEHIKRTAEARSGEVEVSVDGNAASFAAYGTMEDSFAAILTSTMIMRAMLCQHGCKQDAADNTAQALVLTLKNLATRLGLNLENILKTHEAQVEQVIRIKTMLVGTEGKEPS